MSGKYNEADVVSEFNAVDTNKSGTLSLEELENVFIKLGESADDAKIYAQVSK